MIEHEVLRVPQPRRPGNRTTPGDVASWVADDALRGAAAKNVIRTKRAVFANLDRSRRDRNATPLMGVKGRWVNAT